MAFGAVVYKLLVCCGAEGYVSGLHPSSGAQDYYTVIAACGIWCCGFQVVGLV